MRSVKVSITVYYVYTILMCKLGLLCIANSCSMSTAMTSSEVYSVLSPYKTDQRCISIYFDKGYISEIDWRLIPSKISVRGSQKKPTAPVNAS